jgi:3-oxoadipate enol-lactonase/4-carboxymuconolactone decarboxylase
MTELAVIDTGGGTAPPIVWLGSLGSSTSMWDRQIASFAPTRRCVLIDHPGHGASPPSYDAQSIATLAADVLAALDRSGVDRAADFVGLSLGAMVAMSIAAEQPERVDRLALLCTSARFESAAPWQERAATVRAGGPRVVAETIVGRWLTPAYAAAHPDEVAGFVTMIGSTDAESYAGCCDAVAAMDLLPSLARITAPTIVVVGTLDPATPPHHGEAIAAGIAGSRLERLDAAHLVNWELPDDVNRILAAHLDRSDDRFDAGMRVRREVLGDAHVDRAVEATTPFDAEFQRFITETAWGSVWTRDERLDRPTRSCLTIALLTALRQERELALHVRAGLRNGLTPAQIAEVIMHTAVYAGIPAAHAAMRVAKEVVAEDR